MLYLCAIYYLNICAVPVLFNLIIDKPKPIKSGLLQKHCDQKKQGFAGSLMVSWCFWLDLLRKISSKFWEFIKISEVDRQQYFCDSILRVRSFCIGSPLCTPIYIFCGRKTMLYYFNPYQSSVAFLVICDQMTGFYMQSNDWFLYEIQRWAEMG